MYDTLKDIPRFKHASYSVNVPWLHIENFFDSCLYVDENPPYQRGYVWSRYQQERYLEYVLRGGRSGKDIYWNCPNWQRPEGDTIWHETLELVDGKQRLTAIRAFIDDQICAFGKTINQYGGRQNLRGMDHDLVFHVNNLTTKQEVVEWYLGMNTGGSIHTEKDLESAYEYLKSVTTK